jgi:hypothetical protein
MNDKPYYRQSNLSIVAGKSSMRITVFEREHPNAIFVSAEV